MKYFHFLVNDSVITTLVSEVAAVPEGFIEYQTSMWGKGVHYKSNDGVVSEVIGEGFSEGTARMRIEEFLSEYIQNLI
jgi:hypothetical protein